MLPPPLPSSSIAGRPHSRRAWRSGLWGALVERCSAQIRWGPLKTRFPQGSACQARPEASNATRSTSSDELKHALLRHFLHPSLETRMKPDLSWFPRLLLPRSAPLLRRSVSPSSAARDVLTARGVYNVRRAVETLAANPRPRPLPNPLASLLPNPLRSVSPSCCRPSRPSSMAAPLSLP